MSITARLTQKNPELIQFGVEGIKLLKHIPAIQMIKGDASLQFCPMAKALLEDDDIAYVRIERVMDKEYISVSAFGKGVDISQGEKFETISRALETAVTGQEPLLHEDELIAASDAETPPQQVGQFQSLVSGFMRERLMPAVRKNTGHEDAEIKLIRMLSHADDSLKVDLGVTLHNSCATCTASVLATLNFSARSIQKHIFGPNAEKIGGREVAGFVVLPTQSGSPSFTHRPPRALIFSE